MRCYSALWVALSDEFDVEPSAKTQEIAVQIKVNTPPSQAERTFEQSGEKPNLQGGNLDSIPAGGEISLAELAGLNSPKVYLYWTFSTGAVENSLESPTYVSALRYAIEEIAEEYPVGRIQSFSKDEFMLEFESGSRAIHCALAILRLQAQSSIGSSNRVTIKLSIVGHSGSTESSTATAYKLATLSSGNDVIVTSGVRDQITASVDALIEDLGETSFEGYADSVRCFRLSEVEDKPDLLFDNSLHRTVARLAVIPLEARTINAEHDRLIGEVLADELIHLLSKNSYFEVISRQSTKAFCGRESGVTLAGTTLDCDYVLSGWFSVNSDALELSVELSDGSSGAVIYSERYQVEEFRHQLERTGSCVEILNDLFAAVGRHAVKKLRSNAPVALESHKLLTAAVNMMNRFGSRDFFLARKALDVVVSRSPHWAPAHAMLAEWRVMRAQQGWMIDRKRDGILAMEAADRALDCDPECSSAYVADGVVQLHFGGRIDIARSRYDEAIELDRNNCLAWFSRSALRSFIDEGEGAAEDAMKAIELSPVDPASFLYQNAIASAFLAIDDPEKALDWVEKSLSLNRLHASTLRMRIIANWRLGKTKTARRCADDFLSLYPDFSIKKYVQYVPVAESELLTNNVRILKMVGIPE